MAEDAEHCSRGRAAGTGAPLLSIHAVKVFVDPVERSVRRAPRPLECPRVLRVNRLPLSFNDSDPFIALIGSTTLTP